MFPPSFFAPSYFPASFFPEAGSGSGSGVGPAASPYFAPSYFPATFFAPAYFPDGGSGSGSGAPPATSPFFAATFFPPAYFAPTYFPSFGTGFPGDLSYRDTVLATPNVLAYYELTETFGTVAADSVGVHPLTYSGAYTLASPPLVTGGLAATFARSGSGEASGPHSFPALSSTIEFWFNPSDTATSRQGLVFNGSGFNGVGVFLNRESTTSGEICVLYQNVNWFETGFFAAAGRTYQVVLTIDNGWNPSVYVNGFLVFSGVSTPPLPPVNGFSIGTEFTTPANGFSGVIDDVSVYSSVLTPAQILSHYLIGTGVPVPPTSFPDLVAAVVARLRGTPAVTALLGETARGKKIWVDQALGSPKLPWIVVDRPELTHGYSSGGNFIARGEITLHLYAAGSVAAQALSDAITKGEPGDPPGALDDPPLVWRGGRLMKFRLSRPAFDEPASPGVGVPIAYHRVLTFGVMYSGQIL